MSGYSKYYCPKDCPKRTPGCQATCNRYKVGAYLNEKQKAEKRERAEYEAMFIPRRRPRQR